LTREGLIGFDEKVHGKYRKNTNILHKKKAYSAF